MTTAKVLDPVEEQVKEKKPASVKRYAVTLTTITEMLGSIPADPEVYKRFIAEKAKENKSYTAEEIAVRTEAELASLNREREEQGWSTFHKDENGIFQLDYVIRGHMKEACASVTGKSEVPVFKSKIDRWAFIFPQVIYWQREGNPVLKEDSVRERPIRVMTPQGPRTSLKRSDSLRVGVSISFEVHVLPLGQRELNETRLREWFAYGKYQGFGEWRNASYGRFEVTKFEPIE